MCCGRRCWAAPAAPAVTAWRWIPPPAAWWSAARRTADLNTTSVADGNNDSFVASYSSDGSQNWVQQIPTLATNQANAVSVDASGNIYIGGSVSGGVIGAGQTAQGGGDAYLAKLSSNGAILSENQFGTSGSRQRGGHRHRQRRQPVCRQRAEWRGDRLQIRQRQYHLGARPGPKILGALQAGGNISGLAVSGNQVYVSGTTSNGNLTAGGTATVTAAASGGMDAFVLGMTDNGSSATAGNLTYVGTSGSDTGGDVTVGSDGTIYLTGSTTGTFAGQSRNVAKRHQCLRGRHHARRHGELDASSSAAPTASPPARASQSPHPAPVCWTRWACRRAPSTRTSRWT